MTHNQLPEQRARDASDVDVPAITAMHALAAVLVGLGLIGGFLGGAAGGPIYLGIGVSVACVGVGFLLTAWQLTALKQIVHAYAWGWRPGKPGHVDAAPPQTPHP